MVYVSCSVFIWVEKSVFGYRIITHHEIEKHFYARTFMLLFYVMTHRARWVTPLLAYIHNNNNCATCKSLWVKFSHCATQAESNTSFKAGALGRSAVIETPYESMYDVTISIVQFNTFSLSTTFNDDLDFLLDYREKAPDLFVCWNEKPTSFVGFDLRRNNE